jgi:hypothetical protein
VNPSKKTKSGSAEGHLFGVRILEKVYNWLEGLLSVKVLDFSTTWAGRIGHWALVAAACLGFLYSLIFAIRINKFDSFLIGIGWFLLVFVIQFTAHRFLGAGKSLIANNPSRLSSRAFLECVAFLAAILGVVVLINSIITAVRAGSLFPFLSGLGAFVFLEFLAMVTFHPQTITTEIVAETSAGQEALGIITYVLKAVMRLVPIIFGLGVLIFSIYLLIDGFGLFGNDMRTASSWMKIQMRGPQILTYAILPFLSYIVFVLFYLAVDIIRSILVVPEKLDKLGK